MTGTCPVCGLPVHLLDEPVTMHGVTTRLTVESLEQHEPCAWKVADDG